MRGETARAIRELAPGCRARYGNGAGDPPCLPATHACSSHEPTMKGWRKAECARLTTRPRGAGVSRVERPSKSAGAGPLGAVRVSGSNSKGPSLDPGAVPHRHPEPSSPRGGVYGVDSAFVSARVQTRIERTSSPPRPTGRAISSRRSSLPAHAGARSSPTAPAGPLASTRRRWCSPTALKKRQAHPVGLWPAQALSRFHSGSFCTRSATQAPEEVPGPYLSHSVHRGARRAEEKEGPR